MSNKELRSSEFDLQLHLDDGAEIRSRRKTELLPGGALLIEDVLEIKGSGTMTFVLCDAWLVELFELEAGEYSFMRGTEWIRPETKRFGTSYPPFAIMRVRVKDVRGRWTGMTGTEALPGEFATVPLLFDADFAEPPRSVAQLKGILSSSYNRQSIEINPTPSLLSLKAKRLIDENYSTHPSIARVAARLGVTHAHLARQFKRDFGLSPSAYCHQVRIADATSRLTRGEEIIEVSQDVGYNDLSRFYKQFRKTTKKTPGYCQPPKKRTRA